jgi:UDP-glucose 4-epimerase
MEFNFNDKTFLVTGGTGSFGYEIVLKLLLKGAKEVRILSRDEKKQSDIKRLINDIRLKYFIGDVRDKSSMYEAFQLVDFVIHAAALKQVPTMENFPLEAIKTNVFGAQNVIESSIENNVKKVIFLSTDKAVDPINVMGLSKSLMEKLVLSKNINANKLELVITRFGNVVGSRGSVIPIIIEKLKSGLMIPITHEEMTRFFLSLDDAVDLVIRAINFGKDRDILIKNAKGIKLIDLVNVLSQLVNVIPLLNVTNQFPGEKIHEFLVSDHETPSVTLDKDIIVIPRKRIYSDKISNKFCSNLNLMNEAEIKEMLLNNKQVKMLIG